MKMHTSDLKKMKPVAMRNARSYFRSTISANCNNLRAQKNIVWGICKGIPVVRTKKCKYWQLWFFVGKNVTGIDLIDADIKHYKQYRITAKKKHVASYDAWVQQCKDERKELRRIRKDQIEVCGWQIDELQRKIKKRVKKMRGFWKGEFDNDGLPFLFKETKGSKADKFFNQKCLPRINKIHAFEDDIMKLKSEIIVMRDFPILQERNYHIMSVVYSSESLPKNYFASLKGWKILNVSKGGAGEFITWCIFTKIYGDTHGAITAFIRSDKIISPTVDRIVHEIFNEGLIPNKILQGGLGYEKLEI